MKKKMFAIIIVCAMLAGCTSNIGTDQNQESEEQVQIQEAKEKDAKTSDDASSSEEEQAETAQQKESEDDVLSEGNIYHGFLLGEITQSKLLNSDMYRFRHEKSGADLLYIKNEDPECSFTIAYKTPYVDETDTNHVFEHAIIASSEKYPAKDLFFDLANKSYSTFVNAFTYPQTTLYPVASLDQHQLLKMADVYMSCMVAPDILKDENFFKREAIRFELNSPEEEIGINGTVYAEDYGFLTDNDENWMANLLDELYPGEYASNYLGRAEYHYEDLTYENTLATYDRCYHFDNSLIMLYGDLDIDMFLEFLDREYLSKYEVNGTNLSKYDDPLTAEGYIEKVMPICAFEGDTVENNGVITYAIDLQGTDQETLLKWNLLCNVLNRQSSVLGQKLIEDGIQNPVEVSCMTESPKPFLLFKMEYANEDQMQTLKDIAEYTLSEVAKNGVSQELLEAVLSSEEIGTVFIRNNRNVGVDLSATIAQYWAVEKKSDLYEAYERVFDEISKDSSQTILKDLAASELNPRRSVLIAHIPEPGTGEEYEEKLTNYLTDMKNNMSDEEINQMIKDTEDFNKWNEEEIPNTDFLIDPASLEDAKVIPLEKEKIEDITMISGDVDTEGAGVYKLYFDLSGMTRDEIMDLVAYTNLLREVNTSKYDKNDMDVLGSRYLQGFFTSLTYSGKTEDDPGRPIMTVIWESLTEDFEQSLDMVLNLLTETDLNDTDDISYVIRRDAELYDLGRGDGNNLASSYAMAAAGALNSGDFGLNMDVSGQDLYYYMLDAVSGIDSDEKYIKELTEKFDNARKKAYTKTNLRFGIAASADDCEKIKEIAAEKLSLLDTKTNTDVLYELPVFAKSTGIYIESSQNYSYLIAAYKDKENFKGSYIPFIYAANDKYVIPTIRFQLGAYSAGTYSAETSGVAVAYAYSDPNVKKSIDVMKNISDYINDAQLTEDELKGYILIAYGRATGNSGIWNDVIRAINRNVMGGDEEKIVETTNDIKNASLSMKDEAGACLEEVLSDAAIVTAGNESKIYADKEVFDEILNFKEQ
ncbi:MAG: hypothetical protein E7301_04640 [Butyrivibrio sp.]|nr:hypothetical protein [Butyrivibrio sp.]